MRKEWQGLHMCFRRRKQEARRKSRHAKNERASNSTNRAQGPLCVQKALKTKKKKKERRQKDAGLVRPVGRRHNEETRRNVPSLLSTRRSPTRAVSISFRRRAQIVRAAHPLLKEGGRRPNVAGEREETKPTDQKSYRPRTQIELVQGRQKPSRRRHRRSDNKLHGVAP